MRIRFAAGLLLLLVAGNVQADLVTCWNFNSENGNAAIASVDSGRGALFFEPRESQSLTNLLDIIAGTGANIFSWDSAESAVSTSTSVPDEHLETDTVPLTVGEFDGLPEPSSLALSIVAAAIVLPLVRWRIDRPETIPPEKASPLPRRTRRPRPVYKQRLSDIFGGNRRDRIH